MRAGPGDRAILIGADSPDLPESALTEAARALDVKIHTHLCEGSYEIDYSLAKFGMRPAEYLHSLGALDRHMHCAHSVLLSEHEMDLYVKHKPSACHCAYNNYHIGPHRLLEMWRRGVDIGLGTDGAASWGPLDIFQVAHMARVGQQAVNGTPFAYRNVMPSEEMLREMGNYNEKLVEAGKPRMDVVLLPEKGLQKGGVIRKPVENFRRG